MAAPEKGTYLHEDAFKRFSAGNHSMKCLSEYLEERARVEMEYSVSLEHLAAKWNKKLAETLDLEYRDFRTVLRSVFNEPSQKAPFYNKVANKILGEANVLKKQYKDHFKREAQQAIINKYNEALEKQIKLEDKTNKARKRYYRKKHNLEVAQNAMDEFPYRRESSQKFQELLQKRNELCSQATDTYLRFETRLKVESMNRTGFLQEMRDCLEAFDEREMYRLQSVRDRLWASLRHLELLVPANSEQAREHLLMLQKQVKEFPVMDAINAYTAQFMKEHIFPKFEDYQNHGVMDAGPSQGTLHSTNESHLTVADSSHGYRESEVEILPPIRGPSAKPGFTSPTESPVTAWEEPGSDEESEERPDPRSRTPRPLTSPRTLRESDHHRHFQSDSKPRKEGSDESERENTPVLQSSSSNNVTNLTNVRVIATRCYMGKRSTELSFEVGQVIKQKLPANKEGWAYGWIRPNNFSKRRYGIYPAHYVKLQSEKDNTH